MSFALIPNSNIVATNQSSFYQTLYASKMFDGLVGSNQYWLTSGAALPQWASWDYGSNEVGIVGKYALQCNSIPEPLRMPKDWLFQGSDDNTNWATLGTVTGETDWAGSEIREFVCDVANTEYRYYRIYVTANNGNAYVQIGELYIYSSSTATVTLVLDQPVVLQYDVATLLLDQPVIIYKLLSLTLDQPVGLALQMELIQSCRAMPTVTLELNQWTRGLRTVILNLNQPMGAAKTVRLSLNQPVIMPALVLLELNQAIVIAGQLLELQLDQSVQLSTSSGTVTLSIVQPVALGGQLAIVEQIAVIVTIGGRFIDTDYVLVRADDQSAYLAATIRFPDYSQYAACSVGEQVIIVETINGVVTDLWTMQVESLTNQEEPGTADYTITATSPTIALDDELLTEDLGPGIADALMMDLCARYGISLDWQGVANWPFLAGELSADEETVVDVLRRLAVASGAFLQSLPDGSLRLLQEYPVSVETWSTASSSVLDLNDQDHIFSIDEQADPRDGYNAFLVSGESPAGDAYRLEDEALTATTKEIRCYMIPWDAAADIYLDHTGGDWVSIDQLNPASAPYLKFIENEEVEIIAGIGTASYPIETLVTAKYKQDSLGNITAQYDGSLTTATEGDALIEISYWTQYMRWLITDPRAESLQIYIAEVA